jgi:hypothetical protein
MGCPSGTRKCKFCINVDKFGAETTWKLRKTTGGVAMKNSRTYTKNDSECQQMCLTEGTYDLILQDGVGDGICCKSGQGSYELSIERDGKWDRLISGGNFKAKEFRHKLWIRLTGPKMNSRDLEWLEAHNVRRKKYHRQYGKTYVPLIWDESLAASSKVYAEQLLSTCATTGILHDPNNKYGENMAKNRGSGTWGSRYPADNLVRRFVEREIGWGFPDNFHLTQGLWRATKYVGCGEAAKPHNGGTCRMQVCRYAKVGNCNMSSDKWEEKMLADDSLCYPDCPTAGCH